MQLSPDPTATLLIRCFDWSSLQAGFAQILEHRALVRLAGEREMTALDRVAGDLGRIEQMLGVLAIRANESASTPLRGLVVRTYRWAMAVATTLTDLDVATLDRETTPDEAEAFARLVTTEYLALLDPTFDELLPRLASGPRADASLHWDVETLRVGVERVILDVYAIG